MHDVKQYLHNTYIVEERLTMRNNKKVLDVIRWESTFRWKKRNDRVFSYRLHKKAPFILSLMLIIIHLLFSYRTCMRRFYPTIEDILRDAPTIGNITYKASKFIWIYLLKQAISIEALEWSGLKSIFKIVGKIKAKITENNTSDTHDE